MKLSVISAVVVVLLAVSFILVAQEAFPRMTSVDPATVKGGAVVTAVGENLDKKNVSQVFLTDGKNDIKVEVTEQEAASIKFKMPATIKPGRFGLMVLTTGKQPKLIEQPVKVTVEE